MPTRMQQPVQKLETGIPGFDQVAKGGLPLGRTTLVTGSAGSAKTVFATQFLVEGILRVQHPGVFVTFEESPDDIRNNMCSMGWPIDKFEAEGMWGFVDASPIVGDADLVVGEYDLGALLTRIEHAIRRLSAKRISLDSLGAIFSHFTDRAVVRRELLRIVSTLRKLHVTAVMTAERTQEYGDISSFGVEEFAADNVIILRNILQEEKRRRTMEILKFRGTDHQKGEFSFTVMPGAGIIAIPLSVIELKQQSSSTRTTSGNTKLDRMCGGGLFRDSIILVSGATGCGKTLITTEFVAGAAAKGERCLLFAFEESRSQLFRNASGWGVDFAGMEKAGTLRVVCVYPETAGLEDHLIQMKRTIDDYQPTRIAVDSLSALERISPLRGFREFVIGLTAFIKHKEVTGLFTATTATLLGGESVAEAHISTITDTIILLRYVEMFGEMRRGLTVLKMRGSIHDKEIREFSIDQRGMHIGEPFRGVVGILSGNLAHLRQDEMGRIEALFKDG